MGSVVPSRVILLILHTQAESGKQIMKTTRSKAFVLGEFHFDYPFVYHQLDITGVQMPFITGLSYLSTGI